jgi:hypothetical protein
VVQLDTELELGVSGTYFLHQGCVKYSSTPFFLGRLFLDALAEGLIDIVSGFWDVISHVLFFVTP